MGCKYVVYKMAVMWLSIGCWRKVPQFDMFAVRYLSCGVSVGELGLYTLLAKRIIWYIGDGISKPTTGGDWRWPPPRDLEVNLDYFISPGKLSRPHHDLTIDDG